MIDLAILDMAGTTVVDKDFVSKAFQKAFWSLGVEITEKQVNPLMGFPKPIAIEMALEIAGIEFNKAMVEKIHEVFVGEMIDFYV